MPRLSVSSNVVRHLALILGIFGAIVREIMNPQPSSTKISDSNQNISSNCKLIQFSDDIERYKFLKSSIDIVRLQGDVTQYLNQAPEVLVSLCHSQATEIIQSFEGEILASAFLLGTKETLTFSKEFVGCLIKILPSLSLCLKLQTLTALWKATRLSPSFRESVLSLSIRSLDRRCLENINLLAKTSKDNEAEVLSGLAIDLSAGQKIRIEIIKSLTAYEFFGYFKKYPEIIFLPPECYTEPEITARWMARNIADVEFIDERIVLSITKTLDFWNKFPEETILIARALLPHAEKSSSWPFISQFFFGVLFKHDERNFVIKLKRIGLNQRNISHETARNLKTHHTLLTEPKYDELNRYLVYSTDNLKPAQDSVEFHGTLWGSDFYFAAAEKLGIKSLLVSDSVRRLSKQRKITIAIHTSEESRPKVEDLVRKFRLSFISFKIFVTLGKDDASAIRFRGLAWLLAFRSTAVNATVLVPFAPDGFYGEGLDKLIENCPKGGGSWGLTLRCSADNLIGFFSSTEFSLDSIPEDRRNSLLITLGIEKGYHPIQQLMFNNLLSNIGIKPHNNRHTFNTNRNVCWAVRLETKQAVEYVRMARFRYLNNYFDNLMQPLDHELSGYFRSNGSLYVPRDITEFVYLEFTSDSGYANHLKGVSSNFPDIPNNNYTSVPIQNSLAVKMLELLHTFR